MWSRGEGNKMEEEPAAGERDGKRRAPRHGSSHRHRHRAHGGVARLGFLLGRGELQKGGVTPSLVSITSVRPSTPTPTDETTFDDESTTPMMRTPVRDFQSSAVLRVLYLVQSVCPYSMLARSAAQLAQAV